MSSDGVGDGNETIYGYLPSTNDAFVSVAIAVNCVAVV